MCGEEGRRKKMQEGSQDRSGRIGGRRGRKKRMKERGGGGDVEHSSESYSRSLVTSFW